jgi:SHS2 domain-containing protein
LKDACVSEGRFRYLDHMTDAVIEAYGGTLDEAFENSARGLVNTMFDLTAISNTSCSADKEIQIEAKGFDLQSLLYDWLEKVMLVVLMQHILLSDFKVKISEEKAGDYNYLLSGIAKGECLNLEKHHYKVEVKAITYHEMEIKEEKEKNRVTTRFLLDL